MRTKLPKTSDRRVQRTDERLRAAFISLVHERGFGALKIGDVVQRAGVGRSTFYTHFGDLDELHESWLEDFASQSRGERPLFNFLRSFVRHAHAQKGSWHRVGGTNSGTIVQGRFRRKLLALAKDEIEQRVPRHSSISIEATSRYLAGGIADVLFWWIDSANKLSPEKIGSLLEQLAARALESTDHQDLT